MLVVVHYGNIERALQPFLYVKAFGRLDVLEVDAAEGWGDALYGLAKLLRVFLGHLYVEHVDASVYFEQQSLAFHHRLAAHRADVAEAEYGRAVADYGYEVALVGVFVDIVGSLLYFETRERHAGRIS